MEYCRKPVAGRLNDGSEIFRDIWGSGGRACDPFWVPPKAFQSLAEGFEGFLMLRFPGPPKIWPEIRGLLGGVRSLLVKPQSPRDSKNTKISRIQVLWKPDTTLGTNETELMHNNPNSDFGKVRHQTICSES